MAHRTFLELPAEIRNNIYRHVFCYDGIKPEVKSPRSPWLPQNACTRSSKIPLRTLRNSCGSHKTEESYLRMQLNVITPVRNGLYPGVQSLVFARHILNLLYVCRQIYEEAHAIFWTENVFIFPDQDTMHAFIHRIGPTSFELIRTLAIEKTVNAEWINLADGGIDLGYWFADARIPPFLQPLHLYGWETRFEEFTGVRDAWIAEHSDPSNYRKVLLSCKTTYNWLTWPSTKVMEPTKDISGATSDGLFD